MRKLFRIATAFLLFLNCNFAFAQSSDSQEKILNFTSDITVNENSTVTVKENIEVVATGHQIKHGIYRYLIEDNGSKTFDYDVVSVKRDGVSTNYETNVENGFFTIRIGESDVLLPAGIHSYEIIYKTRNQIIPLPNSNKLVWNVTGNGWNFEIDNVTARIHLPHNSAADSQEAYTGALYAKDKNYNFSFDSDNSSVFTTTKKLYPGEGLTVGINFSPNLITPENPIIKNGLAIIVLIAIFLYYLLVWIKVGIDPKKGAIIPLFEPPANLSPAEIGYISEKGNNGSMSRLFSIALVNMAVKKYLKINSGESSFFSKPPISLEVLDNGKYSDLSAEEKEIVDNLFCQINSSNFIYKNTNNDIQDLMPSLGARSRRGFLFDFIVRTAVNQCLKPNSRTSTQVTTESPVLSEPSIILDSSNSAAMLNANLAFSSVLENNCKKGKTYFANNREYFILGVLASFAAAILINNSFDFHIEWQWIFNSIALLINLAFFYLLPAPTTNEQKILEQISGFKMYLETAEKRLLEMSTASAGNKITPEIFEKYLPYAMALKVENKWAEKFATSVAELSKQDKNYYTPLWYGSSDDSVFDINSISQNIYGACAESIKSASSVGGSGSSGFFSGSGGGGGGGGGW